MRPKEAAKREKLRREERGKKRARRKRAAGKVQKCIPLQQECKNIATGFPASRFTLDDRGEQRQFWTFWVILVIIVGI